MESVFSSLKTPNAGAQTMLVQACATGALHCEALHTTTYERGGSLLNISCRANREGHMICRVSGFTILALGIAIAQPRSALAWGDEGHEVVALVAQSFLAPEVRKRVTALLAADTDSLTPHDIASEATWADKFRDANVNGSREKTRQWHFVDMEIAAPDLDAAPRPPTGRRPTASSTRSRNLLRN